MDEYLETNRRLWAEMTAVHAGPSSDYDLEGFKRGGIRLRPWELEEVGDVTGKDLLHLQCHFGLDTLSWARLGARVTGIDFSPEAIDLARATAREIGIDATFVCVELCETIGEVEGEFDIVYASGGALNWLPDVAGWARVAEHFLRPGGFLYLFEAHPILYAMDDAEGAKEPRVRYPYFPRAEPLRWEDDKDYADPAARLQHTVSYEWPHSMGEIVTAVAQAGLRIDFLHEFPHVDWPQPFLEKRDDGAWWLPKGFPGELPLMFSLKATKPAA